MPDDTIEIKLYAGLLALHRYTSVFKYENISQINKRSNKNMKTEFTSTCKLNYELSLQTFFIHLMESLFDNLSNVQMKKYFFF